MNVIKNIYIVILLLHLAKFVSGISGVANERRNRTSSKKLRGPQIGRNVWPEPVEDYYRRHLLVFLANSSGTNSSSSLSVIVSYIARIRARLFLNFRRNPRISFFHPLPKIISRNIYCLQLVLKWMVQRRDIIRIFLEFVFNNGTRTIVLFFFR